MWWLGFRSGPDSGGGVSGGQESGDMFPKLSSKKKKRLGFKHIIKILNWITGQYCFASIL